MIWASSLWQECPCIFPAIRIMIDHRIRYRLEEREETLSIYAAQSRLTRGRAREEPPSPMRTEFQRDRDRIVHSKAFRRLKHKTQVFIAPLDDHYVTRLTHTLEVSQIARSIARALNLNEDLVEAISLGHDLGHTPFGHVGEDVLNELYSGGFSHNAQSLRVVDTLEKNGEGLNLTWEVREGILKHSKGRADLLGGSWEVPSTLEAQICKLSDSVAYINHDISDSLRAGVITGADLPRPAITILGESSSVRINTMVCDIIDQSWSAAGYDDSVNPAITMSPEILDAVNVMRRFLFESVYEVQTAYNKSEKARSVVRFLFDSLVSNPDKLPPEYNSDDDLERRVVDYIAGMTDNYALGLFEEYEVS